MDRDWALSGEMLSREEQRMNEHVNGLLSGQRLEDGAAAAARRREQEEADLAEHPEAPSSSRSHQNPTSIPRGPDANQMAQASALKRAQARATELMSGARQAHRQQAAGQQEEAHAELAEAEAEEAAVAAALEEAVAAAREAVDTLQRWEVLAAAIHAHLPAGKIIASGWCRR